MFSTPAILLLGPQLNVYTQALEDRFNAVYRYWEIDDKAEFLRQHGTSINAVATNSGIGIKKDLFEQLPNVKIVASSGVGFDSIDMAYANAHDIIVTNTPDVLNDCVADTGMMLMYAVARQLVHADSFVKAGNWGKQSFPLTTSLKNKVCGIVGLGAIGSAVAQRAVACGMRIAYTARSDKQIEGYHCIKDVTELAKISDFLVLTVPSTPETEHMITADILQQLGENGYLINIARGNIVDETALIHALKTGQIAGAGLDVFDNEPNINSELFDLPNVTLTPHYASATVETRTIMAELVVANLVSYFEKGKGLTPVKTA